MSYEKGQTVVIERYGRPNEWRIVKTATISSIWMNGVLAVKDGEHTVGTFHPSGEERGQTSSYYRHGCRIRPLAEGETQGTIALALKLSAMKANTEAIEKQQAHEAKVERWWNDTGDAIWSARIPVAGGLLGTEVFILRYIRRKEEYLAFVTVKKDDRAFCGAGRYSIRSGGMVGRDYGDGNKTISTYSSSTAGGLTMHEALYDLCT